MREYVVKSSMKRKLKAFIYAKSQSEAEDMADSLTVDDYEVDSDDEPEVEEVEAV